MTEPLPNARFHICVVDDEPEMREMIADYLRDMEGYTVSCAENGRDALDRVLAHQPVDLVLSDINMPVMKGFELLKIVREQYPDTKRVLITAYNVEEYLDLALTYDIGTIFVKTTPFNFEELSMILGNLLSGDVFGLERYVNTTETAKTFLVRRSQEVIETADVVVAFVPEEEHSRKLRLVMTELLTNAIFYGIRGESPEAKEDWNHEFVLPEEDAVVVKVMFDEEKYAISVTDRGGKLRKKDVLYWLRRQLVRDESGVPIGVFDSHGRGLFIARKYIDRLIINVGRNEKTEVIVINYYSKRYEGHKPLFINEV